jgi:tellurite resistance protein TerC
MVWLWLGFIGFVVLMLAVDLGIFHRQAHVVKMREALSWSAVWIMLGLSFAVFIYYAYEGHWFGIGLAPDAIDGLLNSGRSAAVKYLTGYVVEKSLSIDNIFVIVMIFGFFNVPAIYQHKVLFWGILGALVMRGAMIAIGATLIAEFHWILYLFGVFLLFTGVKMLVMKDKENDPNQSLGVRLVRRLFPITERFYGQRFFIRAGKNGGDQAQSRQAGQVPDPVVAKAKPGAVLLTPLALALIIVETTDLIFAVDSIPAIFAITADPFLVFTSNVFAIMGLRSLYFALAGMLNTFRYLKLSLAIVLMVVGIKMLIAKWLKSVLGDQFNFYLLGVVLLILSLGVIASLIVNQREAKKRD